MELEDQFLGVFLENRYKIKKSLGAGGFGVVFRADQQVLGHHVRQVAIKITKAVGIDAEEAGEILAEAIILAGAIDELPDSVAKRFLVRVYDVGVLQEYERRGFIVMEFIRGMSLTDKMEIFPRMPKDTCLRYVRQICAGLAPLHNLERPIIHRDLKPDNVRLTESDEVRLLDFGLAARIERARGYVEGAAGTEGYMSPETSIRAESSCASDVYSIGVMMYEMLTGVHPFKHLIPPPRLNEEQKRLWINQEKSRNIPPPPSRRNNTVDNHLDSVIMRCLRFNDYDRYPNAAELLKALNQQLKPPVPLREGALADGLKLMQDKQWGQAAATFDKALQAQPSPSDEIQFELHRQLALALLEQRIWTNAIEHIRKAEDLNEAKCFLMSKKQRAEFYHTIAEACKRNGNEAMARKYKNLEGQEL